MKASLRITRKAFEAGIGFQFLAMSTLRRIVLFLCILIAIPLMVPGYLGMALEKLDEFIQDRLGPAVGVITGLAPASADLDKWRKRLRSEFLEYHENKDF